MPTMDGLKDTVNKDGLIVFIVILIGNFVLVSSGCVLLVPVYDELKAGLQALKANVESDAAKQAAQAVYDNLGIFLNFMKQRDGQQVPEASWELANSIMFDLEPAMNGNPTFQEFLYNIGVRIKQLRRQQYPYEPYAEALDNVIVDFKDGLNGFLGGGC